MYGSDKSARKRSLLIFLPFLMLALASIACDLEQKMGSLKLGETYSIEVKDGWEYEWSVELSPGKKYEVVLAQVGTKTDPIYSIVDVVIGALCEDCIKSADGYVTTNGLSVSFVSPENGKAKIRVYVREGTGKCTLLVREIS